MNLIIFRSTGAKNIMKKNLLTAVRMLIVMTVVTGLIYPALTTGIARLCFPRSADGSLIQAGGTRIGSELIGQKFVSPRYFHGRPSAAGTGYDALASGASNLGPTNEQLMDEIDSRIKNLRQENGLNNKVKIPADLVTASGSGLDPDISPEGAYLQVKRVAQARDLPEQTVRNLVRECIQGRQLGILGEPRVNVLELNIRLDELAKDYPD
jgi:K+-transporting ATPase ATPase C chain